MLRHILLFALLLTFVRSSMAFPDIPYLESGLPQGDYTNQCSECQVIDNTLSCLCDSGKGKSYPRTLDLSLCSLPLVSIKNSRLHCETDLSVIPDEDEISTENSSDSTLQDDPHSLLPGGSYRSQCKDCEIRDGVLECRCKIAGWFYNSWYNSSLPLPSCSRDEKDQIVFAGGHLFCSLNEMLDFHGLKKVSKNDNSCSNCYLSGTTLRCDCNKTKCGWSSKDFSKELNVNKNAYLNNATACTGNINNCNGKLRCGECWAYDFFDQGEWHRPNLSTHPKYGYCYPNAPW